MKSFARRLTSTQKWAYRFPSESLSTAATKASLFAILGLIPALHAQAQAQSKMQRPASNLQCETSRLRFSADIYHPVPEARSRIVWGGNATWGQHVVTIPFSSQFISAASKAKQREIKVFAYLEGPCGDTDGKDDGERGRCRRLHREFNRKYAKNTPDTDLERWKPYTFHQMKLSAKYGIDFCEIDNLNNNVNVPLLPLLREIKSMYDRNEIHCQLVLKNINVGTLDRIRSSLVTKTMIQKRGYAQSLKDFDFIANFHIFEDSNEDEKRSLDAAMRRLKGEGAVTIISTDTNRYGHGFTQDKFLACSKAR